ncbi:putative nuclease HARBI1 [Myxocyprinus asiaticus]|uniref:putative nuclease HARBI1 n=1 Tax=Myxocyprinus asiaticus TaxID=70543 RepID=UPI002222750A|nr:putative nuclease HARBI1 [Myxocyprinus asiaticus]
MSCPFLRQQPVAEGARIIRRAFRINCVLRDRQDPLAQRNTILFERYLFSHEGVIYIINLLEPHIKCLTRRSLALTTAQTVCIALRFFASGTFLYTFGDAENLVKSAVCRAIRKVYLALKHFLGVFVEFPSHLTPQVVKQNLFAIAGFPNVIGAIDCTHIPIKAPPGSNGGDFVNRKGVHSVNVQMVCDSMCHITNVEAKWPGSVHDSRIFRESHLCTLFERGDYDGILLGDRGYTCRQYFMTPFPDPNPGSQTRYSAALARTRARIEMTFGQLKGRFQCLKSLRVAPDKTCDIIVACAVLHNIATIRKERTPVVEVQPDDHLQPVHLDQPSGRAARDRSVEHHF